MNVLELVVLHKLSLLTILTTNRELFLCLFALLINYLLLFNNNINNIITFKFKLIYCQFILFSLFLF
jgi:hypothetical protein